MNTSKIISDSFISHTELVRDLGHSFGVELSLDQFYLSIKSNICFKSPISHQIFSFCYLINIKTLSVLN